MSTESHQDKGPTAGEEKLSEENQEDDTVYDERELEDPDAHNSTR